MKLLLIVSLLMLLTIGCEKIPCMGDPLPNCPKCGATRNSESIWINTNRLGIMYVICSRCTYEQRILPLDNKKCKCENNKDTK